MVKPTRKSPVRKHHRKPIARRMVTGRKDIDNASIDALFDDFARNLARKITSRNAGAPARKNDQ